MNRHEISQEFETKLTNGELYSCTLADLNKYLEALLIFEGSIVTKYPERASQIQILNNIISVKTLNDVAKTIEHTEDTIKKLDDKNSFLTKVVVFLAALSFIATCAQIYFTVWPPSKATNHQSQEINLHKSESLSSQNLPSKEHTSKLPKPKNINSPGSKSGKTETFEKESYHPPKSPK